MGYKYRCPKCFTGYGEFRNYHFVATMKLCYECLEKEDEELHKGEQG